MKNPFASVTDFVLTVCILIIIFWLAAVTISAVLQIKEEYQTKEITMPGPDTRVSYIGFFKECPTCKGKGHTSDEYCTITHPPGMSYSESCRPCAGQGMRAIFIPLVKVAQITGMSTEAFENLKAMIGAADR